MRLKSIELQGFKSFADKTVLDFKDGITAVVGPNGSGKSNISDAIRWVMGEQSAKSLRGGNMQDIIFAGTQKRKPLGFAEVSLIIDNTDKKLPIDYEEVVVTRRVFRSGESEYFINKSSVRLKDVHELFMDTGVGRDGYSIIGQGKIAEIVNTKSEDRRSMFEEAAGITKFRYRKEEAERKLQKTNDNVLRVNDIITEIEGQIGPLKQQSEKAKKYLILRDKLKLLEVNVSLKNIEKYREVLDTVLIQATDLANQLADVENKIIENERETENIFAGIADAEKDAEENREKQQASIEKLSDYKSDIEVLKSKIDGNNENIKRIELEINELNDKFNEVEKSVEFERQEISKIDVEKENVNDNINNLEDELGNYDKTSSQEAEYIDQINTEIIEIMNNISNIRSKISNFNALIQSYNERELTIKKELDDKAESYNSLKSNVSNLEIKCKNLEKETNDFKADLENKRKEYQDLNVKLDKYDTELKSVRDEYQTATSRYKILKDMEKSFDNYNRSVKAVMTEKTSGLLSGATLYGTVAGLVSVEQRYATAIEVAMGGSAQNIVVNSEDDAKKAIEFLKRTKQGRATFLPLSASKGASFAEKGVDMCRGYIGIASNLVSYDTKFKNIISSILGRVVIVDNIDNAVFIAKKYSYKFKIVTLDGDMLSPGGSMSGGSRNHSSGILSKSIEIAELDKKIKELELKISTVEKEYNKTVSLVRKSKEEFEAINSKLILKNEEFIKENSNYMHSKAFLESVEESKKALDDELAQLTNNVLDMNEQIEKKNLEVKEAEAQIEKLNKKSEIKKELLGSTAKKRQEISEGIGKLKLQILELDKKAEIFNEKIRMVDDRKKEIELGIEQKNVNIAEMKNANDDILEDINFKNQQIEDIELEIEQLKNMIDSTEKSRKDAQESIKKQQENNKQLRESQLVLQQEQNRIDSKKVKSEVELENTINKLWEDYELTVSSAEEIRCELPSNANKQITEIKGEIKSLGNINIDAIEEYSQISERYEFLKTQRDDLVEAQKNLQQVIEDMLVIMKSQFSDKFKVINKYFGEIFEELFGGGKAELKLTEPSDILNSGVDIDVQPPGKAVKSLLQLSGGEQAFVSIALLFAILKVRPAPFCVLDEIEAALDDVNVYRYADYLKKISKNSQFIVVTHRRGTMESAGMLYGVTMQEQGVSKLLSLDIDEVVDMK